MGTTNILDLNNRVSDLEKAVSGGDSAQANKKDIATEFSTTTAYTAGCFVYYGGKLYQFNTDHAAGAWDSTDVVEANVTDQVVSNAAAIAGLTASDVAYDNTDSGLTATDVQGAIDELDDALDKLKANTMRGTDTLSFDTEYIASSDGYIRGIVNHGSGKFVQIMLYFSAAATYGLAAKVGDSPNENQACVVYVRKGMKYKVNCSSINDATCSFIPLS